MVYLDWGSRIVPLTQGFRWTTAALYTRRVTTTCIEANPAGSALASMVITLLAHTIPPSFEKQIDKNVKNIDTKTLINGIKSWKRPKNLASRAYPAFRSAGISAKLRCHAQRMHQLRLSGPKFPEKFRDRPGFNATTKQRVHLLRPRMYLDGILVIHFDQEVFLG